MTLRSYSKAEERDTSQQDDISVLVRFLSSHLPEWRVRGERTSNGNYSFKTNMRVALDPNSNTYSLTLSRWELTYHELASVVSAIQACKYPSDAMFTKFNNKFFIPLEDPN